MNTRYFWTDTEAATLLRMAHAGATNQQIADATGRTIGSVRRRRQEVIGKRQRTGKLGAPTPLARRIVTLEATIAAAMRERWVDWALVDEYLSGLEVLRRWCRG